MMTPELVTEVFKSLISQGPLVGLLFYLHVQNRTAIEKKESENSALNKELRDTLEKNLNKSNEIIVNNTMAFTAFKEAIKDA